MGKTSSAVKDRYNAKVYDEIKVRVAKGRKEMIRNHALSMQESTTAFINREITETIPRDTAAVHGGE